MTAEGGKNDTVARNLGGRDESHSINENYRWVLDDSGHNILEEAGLRQSIRRLLPVCMDGFYRAKPGRDEDKNQYGRM